MLGLIPRAHELRQHRAAVRHDHNSIGRPQLGQRHPFDGTRCILHPAVHGQDQCQFGVARAALRIQIEMPQFHNIVAPELQANWFRHAERIDIENAAAHGELRHVFDHRDALEANRFQMRGQLLRTTHIALSHLQSRAGERAWQQRLLEHGAGRGEQQANAALTQLFESLHPLAGDFRVRLDLAKPFTRWIERHRNIIDERLQIGEPTFRLTHLIGHDDHETLRHRARECGDKYRITTTRQAANAQ